LAKKGYIPQKKTSKYQPDQELVKKRYDWAMKHIQKDATAWKNFLQGVADMKLFTYYPKTLKPKHKALRSSWTYMNKKERYKKAFQRPKVWFPGDEYKLTKKQRLFGLTASNGKILAFLVPPKYTGELWAKDVEKKVAPFLRKAFPGKTSFRILLDGEPLLHKPVAKRAMRKHNIEVLAGWPKNPVSHDYPQGTIRAIGTIKTIIRATGTIGTTTGATGTIGVLP